MDFRDHTINDIHKNLYFWMIKNNKPLMELEKVYIDENKTN